MRPAREAPEASLGALAGRNRPRSRHFVTPCRCRDPFEVRPFAIQTVAVLESDDMARWPWADERLQDQLSQ